MMLRGTTNWLLVPVIIVLAISQLVDQVEELDQVEGLDQVVLNFFFRPHMKNTAPLKKPVLNKKIEIILI